MCSVVTLLCNRTEADLFEFSFYPFIMIEERSLIPFLAEFHDQIEWLRFNPTEYTKFKSQFGINEKFLHVTGVTRTLICKRMLWE